MEASLAERDPHDDDVRALRYACALVRRDPALAISVQIGDPDAFGAPGALEVFAADVAREHGLRALVTRSARGAHVRFEAGE